MKIKRGYWIAFGCSFLITSVIALKGTGFRFSSISPNYKEAGVKGLYMFLACFISTSIIVSWYYDLKKKSKMMEER